MEAVEVISVRCEYSRVVLGSGLGFFGAPAVHLHKADFASNSLEVSAALKCSNPSSTFRQPFLIHSTVTAPANCGDRLSHAP